MKKLYYLFFLLPFLSLTSCEKDNNEVVNMQYQDPLLTATAISSVQGYVGDQFTITGTDFGAAKQFIKVFIGQNQAKIVSCSDEKIVAEVPEEATTGKVSIELLGETITTEWMYKVLGKPSVETMNPIWGFAGDEITFGGSDLGTKVEDVQLYFGTSKTMAQVTSWTPETFAVEVPADATSGKITLNIATQKDINTPNEFTVREHSTLIAVTPTKADKRAKLTITGTHFGATMEGVKVLFGDTEGEVVSCTENAIEVKVPTEVTEGPIKVTVETPYEKVDGELDFTVTSTPTIHTFGNKLVRVGQDMTITGTGFISHVDDISIDFAGTVVHPKTVSSTAMTVQVPVGFSAGKLSITFGSIPVMEVGNLQALNVGDITDVVLKNSKPPFERIEEKAGEWATAKDWLYNDVFIQHGGSIQYPNKDGNKENSFIGLIRWGQKNQNGKMYQTMKLPSGKYKAILNVARCGGASGRFRAYFIVSKGEAEADIPDLDDPNSWISGVPGSIISHFDITSRVTGDGFDNAYSEELEFHLEEEENDIIIGFVTQLQGNRFVNVSSIQLGLVE